MDGFYYVSQDNYHIVNLNKPSPNNPEKYLYSDSATSCIIMIIQGKDKNDNPIVALSHLGHSVRFLQFFKVVEQHFVGPVSVYAQGANPPWPSFQHGRESNASLQNAQTVMCWVQQNTRAPDAKEQRWYINQCTLSLGQGIPHHNNQDCYGIDLTTLTVSNQRFKLSHKQRDPTDGLQTLYCIFGLEVDPPIELLQTGTPFTPSQTERLVEKAKECLWTNLLMMDPEDILSQLSSTPEYEVPWFVETLKQSAHYVKNYSEQKAEGVKS